VNVRVVKKILSPGVEHAKEADVRAKMFGISCNLQQSRGTGAKQQTIQNLLIVER
jgi:hypothetical protein